MKMQKRQFRIGELAKKLDVEKFVIRFWEKEFNLSSCRSNGGQRFYSQEDLDLFTRIKALLYQEKFTISGAKKQLSETRVVASSKTSIESSVNKIDGDALNQLLALKKQLLDLKEML